MVDSKTIDKFQKETSGRYIPIFPPGIRPCAAIYWSDKYYENKLNFKKHWAFYKYFFQDHDLFVFRKRHKKRPLLVLDLCDKIRRHSEMKVLVGRREWNSAFSAVSATITDMWLTFSSQLLPSPSSPKPIFALKPKYYTVTTKI